ncbi:hypothetical protein [Gemmatimonas sp.]
MRSHRSSSPVARRFARLGAPVAALAISWLAGCYTYQPLTAIPEPGKATVRFVFTADGAKQLRDAAGFEMRQLDGTVLRTLADSAVVVKPDAIVTVDGDELPWRRAELIVPWRTVARGQRRTMDKKRSRGFAAIMGAAFTGVVYFALKSIAGGSGATLQPGSGVPE